MVEEIENRFWELWMDKLWKINREEEFEEEAIVWRRALYLGRAPHMRVCGVGTPKAQGGRP